MDIVIGVTGATGTIYAIKLLEKLNIIKNVNTHLIMSPWAVKTLEIETEYNYEYIKNLATYSYDYYDLGARISSGSFLTNGMIVLPCSMKTLSGIAHGYDDNLITRCAGVMLKEHRKLILCPRETPLNPIHIENMLKLSRIGVRIVPPMPAFYNHPKSVDDIINHHIMKVLDQFGINTYMEKRWEG